MDYQKCLIGVIIVCCCVYESAAQKGSVCLTPNADAATCVSILDCKLFISAIRNNISSQIRFIKSSQCGWQTDALVCCGNRVDFVRRSIPLPTKTNPIEGRLLMPSSSNVNFRRSSAIPSRSSCGFQDSDNGIGGFVVGGTETKINEFPWMALLGYTDNYGNLEWSCGGSLISQKYVLTAGHCVTGDILTKIGRLTHIKLGEHNTQTEIDCDKNQNCNLKPVIAGPEQIIVHPNYETNSNAPYDIALIRLNQRIPYTSFTRPICLPEPSESSEIGYKLTAAGWGRTRKEKHSPVILQVDLPLYNKQECGRIYLSQGVYLLNSQICAGGVGGKDSCSGDSGGPLMRRSKSNSLQWYQEGLVSFGSKYCGISGLPAVYTKVSDFLPWIHSVVKD